MTEIETKIWDALNGASYVDEVAITSYLSECTDRSNKNMPFLRVWATGQDEIDDIVRRLDLLDIDIEVAPLLQKFIPRRSSDRGQFDQLVAGALKKATT